MIIGYLESFTNDWVKNVAPIINFTAPYNFNFGIHPQSHSHPSQSRATDPNKSRESLEKLLEDNKDYRDAICHYVLIDYMCLPNYSLPDMCNHLLPLLNEGREIIAQ